MKEPGPTRGKSISEDHWDRSDFIYSTGSHACRTASHQSMEARGPSTPTQDVHAAQMGR